MAQTVDVTRFRSEFPITEQWAYLNHASHGPYPIRTAEAIKAFADGWTNPAEFSGSYSVPSGSGEPYSVRIVRECREGIAELAGGSPENVVFVGSLAEGMNLLGNGIDWREGDNVIIPGHEFPSVVYPFMNLQRKGVEVRFVERNADGRTDPAIIEAAMDERTRAVAISHIEWQDGYRNDLEKLGDLCRGREVELFVDATQSLGAQPIDLEETGVTAIAAHGYKWLLSGFGNGVVVFNQGAMERITPTYLGRLSINADAEDQNWRLDLKDTAERYQTGGLDILSLTALHGSLSLLREVTPRGSSAQTLQVTDYLVDELKAMDYDVVSDRSPEHRSQIVTCSCGDNERNAALIEELEAHNVSVALRGGRIRVSPFFYNTTADIDRLLEVLGSR